jgi:quercetin dioxygenase-like cupin family protein
MKIYRFDKETGTPLEEHGSSAANISNIASINEPSSVKCIHLEANGLVGSHPAESAQILLVVQGEGHLRGEGAIRTPIRAGQAVYWERGEWHETSTDSGMMAIVIEGEDLDPGMLVQEE